MTIADFLSDRLGRIVLQGGCAAASALFLLAGFLLDLWHIAWVVFPIGGILCAIVDTLRKK